MRISAWLQQDSPLGIPLRGITCLLRFSEGIVQAAGGRGYLDLLFVFAHSPNRKRFSSMQMPAVADEGQDKDIAPLSVSA